jgi:hypothetical protein
MLTRAQTVRSSPPVRRAFPYNHASQMGLAIKLAFYYLKASLVVCYLKASLVVCWE